MNLFTSKYSGKNCVRRALLPALAVLLLLPVSLRADNGTGESEVWRNYDFVPGRNVLFASDFSREPVGRFPASQLEFVKGNAQIVEKDGQRVLEISDNSVFRIRVPKPVSGGFTLEFSYLLAAPNMVVNVFFGSPKTAINRWPSHYISIFHKPGIYYHGSEASAASARQIVKNQTPFKFQWDGTSAMFYAGPERVGMLPSATIQPWEVVEFHVIANSRFRSYLTDIVLASGLDPLYETLIKNGAYTTRGILFEVDKAELRQESISELRRIEEALQRDPKLSFVIEGHTDNVGSDNHNLELSQRRAMAVVNYLVDKGVSQERLQAVGKGASSPVTANDTAQGRMQNRRVVIRLKDGA